MEDLTLIKELNLLWEPVRPYLARQIHELYGREDGHILEIGPFSGLLFTLARQNVGDTFLIAAFPEAAIGLCRNEARKLNLENRVTVIETDASLRGVLDHSTDLAIFRGALFFPSLFPVDFEAIYRTLKRGGIAFVGGGFGKYTPPDVIRQIGERSAQLNLTLGKVRVTVESVRQQVHSSIHPVEFDITTEGGLWIVIRK